MKLCVPEKILHQHAVILGKTGAGKSSKLRHIVEHLLAAGKRVCIVDPKGDWYGLKTSADGKAPGFPVIAFGDFKEPKATDIPINAQSGKQIAELITSGNRPCIIGMRGWMPSQLVKFWLDFAGALFNAQSGELYLVIDEVHNFSPKGKILDPEAGRCIHWTNRLMSEGRGLGLVCFIASQRPQKVHNDTLTSCETLIAARVIHKADRSAVKDWIDGCGDSDRGNEVLNGLAQLARPEAWVWSPEAGFGPEKVTFPMFETFDSFAPVQLQKKISGNGWATVNLDDVKAKLASVIEEAKQNDPENLKLEIRNLKKDAELARSISERLGLGRDIKDWRKVTLKLDELVKKAAGGTPALLSKTEIKEVPTLTPTERTRLTALIESYERLETVCERMEKMATEIKSDAALNRSEVTFFKLLLSEKLSMALPQRAGVRQPNCLTANPAARVREPGATNSKGYQTAALAPRLPQGMATGASLPLPTGEEKILSACIQFPDGVLRQQLTILAGFKRSTRDKYIARLREKGLVEVSGETVFATAQGVAALPDAQPLPTGVALQQYHLERLPEGERKFLEILIERYPDSVSRDEISDLTGFKRSTRDKYLSRMAAKMLFTEPARGMVRAADQLF